jgi:hypothetical protein
MLGVAGCDAISTVDNDKRRKGGVTPHSQCIWLAANISRMLCQYGRMPRPTTVTRLVMVAAVVAISVCGCSSSKDTKSADPQAGTPSATPTGPASTPMTTQSSGTASSNATACANLDLPGSVRAALVKADGRPGAATQPDESFYGACGPTFYAVASFKASTTATTQESVAFQDNGAEAEFFVKRDRGTWVKVGTTPGPPTPSGEVGCANFTQLPQALKERWHDCRTS